MAEDLVSKLGALDINKKSYGIFPWVRINGQEHVILQTSFSADKKDYKVDPFRGKQKEGETQEQTASRECKEESAYVLSLPTDKLGKLVPSRDGKGGMFHCRLVFESPNDLQSLPGAYDTNRCHSEIDSQPGVKECDGLTIEDLKKMQDHNKTNCGVRVSKEIRDLQGMPKDMPIFYVKRRVKENGVVNFIGEVQASDHDSDRLDHDEQDLEDTAWRFSRKFHEAFKSDSNGVTQKKRTEDMTVYPKDYDENGHPIPRQPPKSSGGNYRGGGRRGFESRGRGKKTQDDSALEWQRGSNMPKRR